MEEKEYFKKTTELLDKLLDKATNAHPTDLLKRIDRYYMGTFDKLKDKVTNQRNVIRSIVETKTTLICDAQIVTTVVPATKNMAQVNDLMDMIDKADIIDNCVREVFEENKFDTLRLITVRDVVKKMGILETYWDADDQQIKMKRHSYLNFYPDPSCVEIENANFIFIKEVYSPITLKAKYPQYAERLDKLIKTGSTEKGSGTPQAVISSTVSGQVSQTFTYPATDSILQNLENVVVWKVYFKDDSPFVAEELSTKNEQKKQDIQEINKYPHGRMILYIKGDDPIILEDQPIAYPFGYPIDVCHNTQGNDFWESTGDVEGLFENQDRINNAYGKAKEMVGKFVSFIVNDPRNGIKKSDFINRTVLEGENFTDYGPPQMLTNNTMEKFNLMVEYLQLLTKDAYDISRLNEQMVSGTSEEPVTSGEQVKALNESPMTGIRSLQRNYKEFLINVTNKVVTLIQMYYTTARIIKTCQGDKFIRIPTAGSGDNIEMYDKTFQKIQEIKGDLSIGKYDIEIISGSDRPRSRSENANLMMGMFDKGIFGQSAVVKGLLFDALDIPNKRIILDQLQKEEQQAQQNPPSALNNPDLAEAFAKGFGALEGFTAARRKLLDDLKLPSKQDDLEDAPVQEIARQSSLTDVAALSPKVLSKDLDTQEIGQSLAIQKDFMPQPQQTPFE